MFRCCSLGPSHPRLLPQSLKDCSINLCLFFFFCSAYRVILKHFSFLLSITLLSSSRYTSLLFSWEELLCSSHEISPRVLLCHPTQLCSRAFSLSITQNLFDHFLSWITCFQRQYSLAFPLLVYSINWIKCFL